MFKDGISIETYGHYMYNYTFSLFRYQEKYLHLFNYTVENMPRHAAYLCPLCISKAAIVYNPQEILKNGPFSIDHYPPQSIGGFQSILVCTECNNKAGSDYESVLPNWIKEIAFDRRIKGAEIRTHHKITDIKGRYHSTFKIRDDGELEISLKPYKNHSPLLDKFIESQEGRTDYSIEVTMPRSDTSKVAKSLLKASYLHCFALWGYEFVFSYTGEMIRKVLKGEAEYPTKAPRFFLGDVMRAGTKIPNGVCYLNFPKEWRSFIVNLAVVDDSTGFAEITSVLIPGPSKECWDKFYEFDAILNESPISDVNMNHVTEFVIPNSLNGYSKSWEFLCNKD